MKTLSISLYNREEYTRTLLDSLDKCFNIDDYEILICCEPTNQNVINLAKNFRPNQTIVKINDKKYGCNNNIFQCIELGFEKSDYHIHFEDDTIPGKDCLLFFEWANNEYKNDKSVFNVSGYVNSNNIGEHFLKKTDDIQCVSRRIWFTPWGWATWKDRWDEVKDSLKIQLSSSVSWDVYFHKLSANRNEIFPCVSRIQNIGAENGTYVPNKEWHKNNQYNEFWIESIEKYTYKFYETEDSVRIENILKPENDFKEIFEQKCQSGINSLASKKIAFVGLCRNNGDVLEKNITKIVDDIASKCMEYKIILFENDSTDNTKEVLKKLTDSNENIYAIVQDLNREYYSAETHPEKSRERARTEALSQYRNFLKNYCGVHLAEYDFLVVFDTDFIDFSQMGVFNSFGWLKEYPNISAITGNGFQFKKIFSDKKSLWNYDSWAYRGSWWTCLNNYPIGSYKEYDPMLWFGLWIPPVGSNPISVNSAFGGMGIYRSSVFYDPNSKYEGYDCEHVCFHYNLYKNHNKFNLMLNPSQVMLFK